MFFILMNNRRENESEIVEQVCEVMRVEGFEVEYTDSSGLRGTYTCENIAESGISDKYLREILSRAKEQHSFYKSCKESGHKAIMCIR